MTVLDSECDQVRLTDDGKRGLFLESVGVQQETKHSSLWGCEETTTGERVERYCSFIQDSHSFIDKVAAVSC